MKEQKKSKESVLIGEPAQHSQNTVWPNEAILKKNRKLNDHKQFRKKKQFCLTINFIITELYNFFVNWR